MGSGSKRNQCSVASRPLLFAKTPVFAVCGHKVLLLKLPWARLYTVILGGFSATACSVRQEPWLLTASCSGGALISPVPPICFPLEAVSTMGESRNIHSAGLGVSCHLVPPPLPAHSHTHRAWAPGTTQTCRHPGPLVLGGLEHVCCLSH